MVKRHGLWVGLFVGNFSWLATKTSRSHFPTVGDPFFNWLVIVLVKAWGSTIQGMNDACAPLSTEGASSHYMGQLVVFRATMVPIVWKIFSLEMTSFL